MIPTALLDLGGMVGATLTGNLDSGCSLAVAPPGVQLVVSIFADPIELADGDHYVVHIYRRGESKPVWSFDRSVRYAESYPTGAECDPVPCRHLELHEPLVAASP